MTTPLFIIAAVVYIVIVRVLAGHQAYRIAQYHANGKPNGDDWRVGTALALVWPLWAPFWMCKWTLQAANSAIPAIGAERAYHMQTRETNKKALEQRSDEMEQTVDLWEVEVLES